MVLGYPSNIFPIERGPWGCQFYFQPTLLLKSSDRRGCTYLEAPPFVDTTVTLSSVNNNNMNTVFEDI